MGVYRQIKVCIWQDSFILDLIPEDKLFYLYLLTNAKSTQCGIFEVAIRMMVFETGLSKETILAQIQKFVGWNKIVYDETTYEFLIVNWMKHNIPNNPSVKKCVDAEIKSVQSPKLKKLWASLMVSTPCGTVPTPCVMVSTPCDTVSEKNEILTKEKNRKEEEEEQGSIPGCSLGFVEINKDITSLPPFKEQEPTTEQNNTTHPAEETKGALSTEEGVGNSFSHSLLGGEPNTKPPDKPGPKPSGSANPPPVVANSHIPSSPEVRAVLQHLNRTLCAGYRYDNPDTASPIQKQLDRGFTVEECLKVIDKKKKDWDGTYLEGNLTPMLLFSDKFESYLQQRPRSNHKYQHERPQVSTFTNKTLVEV